MAAESIFDRAVSADGSTGVWLRHTYTPTDRTAVDAINFIDVRVDDTGPAFPASMHNETALYPGLIRFNAANDFRNLRTSIDNASFSLSGFGEFHNAIEETLVLGFRIGADGPVLALDLAADRTQPYNSLGVVGYQGFTPTDTDDDGVVFDYTFLALASTDDVTIAFVNSAADGWDAAALAFDDTARLSAQPVTAVGRVSRPVLTVGVSGIVLSAQPVVAAATVSRPRLTGRASVPVGLAVTARTLTTLRVGWNPPASDGGSAVTGYQTRIGSDPWTDLPPSATDHEFGGLIPGGTYTMSVRAVTASGPGATAETAGSTLPAVAPSAPRFVTARTEGLSVRISLESPAFDGGAAVGGYEVNAYPTGDVPGVWEPVGLDTSFVVRGLAQGRTYTFLVRARNAAGVSISSDPVSATPLTVGAQLPPAPAYAILLADAVRQSQIVRLGDTDGRLIVWWQPSDRAWYMSVERPVNTRLVSGRRMTVGVDLISEVEADVSLTVWPLSDNDVVVDPGRDAWRRGTHILVWAPS